MTSGAFQIMDKADKESGIITAPGKPSPRLALNGIMDRNHVGAKFLRTKSAQGVCCGARCMLSR